MYIFLNYEMVYISKENFKYSTEGVLVTPLQGILQEYINDINNILALSPTVYKGLSCYMYKKTLYFP